jgi:AraC-like DNA-binding protein
MFIQHKPFPMKSDGFLPRFHTIACKHSIGNQLLGIKFKVSPILLDKKIDFSEYQHAMFSLSYLLPATVVHAIKTATSFSTAVHIIESYFNSIIHQANNKVVATVTQAIQYFESNIHQPIQMRDIVSILNISTKTLQRYFSIAVGIQPKQVCNTIRIRKALQSYLTVNDGFTPSMFGYYDYSHFYKHSKAFLQEDASDIFSIKKAK